MFYFCPRRMWITVMSCVCCATLAFVNGCTGPSSSKPQDLILGKWTWTGPLEGKVTTITNDFTRDGLVKVMQGGVPFEAKYRFVDDSHIEYDLGVLKQHSTIESITENKLVVIDEQGVRREWGRPQ